MSEIKKTILSLVTVGILFKQKEKKNFKNRS